MRRLLAFALLLLIGGGIGWSVYERQREGGLPTAEDAPPVAAPPKAEAEPADEAGSESEAAGKAVAEPAPAAPQPVPNTASPATERQAPEFEPPRVVTPMPEAPGPADRGRRTEAGRWMAEGAPAQEPRMAERGGEGPLSFEAIRRSLSALLGEGRGEGPEAAPPEGAGAKKALAELKGDPGAAPQPPAVAKPSFDIVRVGRDGAAVMAGRAEPGAEVEIRVGERVLDRVVATRRGQWVSTPQEPIRAGDRELSLAARVEGGPRLVSDQVVVVAVPEVDPARPRDLAQASPPPRTSPARPASGAVPIAAATGPGDPVAVLLSRDDAGTGRVLQAPGRISGDGGLALLVLDYDDSGRVRLAGEGPPGAPVRIYVDNQPAGVFSVAQDGTWRAVLHERLEAGTYTLRLDQLDASGKPTARLETPFTRAAHPPVVGQAEVDYVIVQPGNSLWRISRRLFGHGFRHMHIFAANRGQIRDPDLIYPGQVFEVPASLSESG
jgi:nucleoid-associated protein YgaU